MNMRIRLPRRPLPHLLVLAGSLLVVGCGILDEDTPENVRVLVQGSEGHPIVLITSGDFIVTASDDGEDREVALNSADTAFIAPPFDRQFALGPLQRFYATMTSEDVPSQPVSVKIWVGNNLRYDRETVFGDEILQFVYTFR